MTDNQKKAIQILNKLNQYVDESGNKGITDNEYFLLMEFILANNSPQIQYVPYPVETPQITPWQTQPWTTQPVYATDSNTSHFCKEPSWYNNTTQTVREKNVYS